MIIWTYECRDEDIGTCVMLNVEDYDRIMHRQPALILRKAEPSEFVEQYRNDRGSVPSRPLPTDIFFYEVSVD